MDLVVKNGRVYASGRLQAIDLFVRDGRVAALGGAHEADEALDARGLMVLPGAVDLHVHFREPGATYKEDWTSGSLSAAAGGVTTVVDQPNTNPRTLDRRSFELKLEMARHGCVVDFCINGGPGKIEELTGLGASAIGEIFTYEHDPRELLSILREAERVGALPTIHAEDGEVVQRYTGPLKEEQDPDVYSRARPPIAEAEAIGTVLSATRRAHICHLSSEMGLGLIREARMKDRRAKKTSSASFGPPSGRSSGRSSGTSGYSQSAENARVKATGKTTGSITSNTTAKTVKRLGVTCEVAPHHLLFNRRDYKKQGTFLKMNPPLRSPSDNDALWQGLRAGVIDVIASDHAPHLPEEKRDDVWLAPPGVPGVETTLPLMLSAVKSNFIDLDRVIDAMCQRPAEILGLRAKGEIAVGKDADLVLIDPKSTTKIRADRLHSRADWTPYEGRQGIFPVMTVIRGTVVFDGDLAVRPGFGRFLPGPGRCAPGKAVD